MSQICQAHTNCEDKGFVFSELFCYQFHASRIARSEFQSFDYFPIADWHIYAGQGLKAVLLYDSTERVVGVFMGRGVAADGSNVDAQFVHDLVSDQPGFLSEFERRIEGIAGRFVVFVLFDQVRRLYFDPVAHLSAVYDPKRGVVASSTLLAIDDPMQDQAPFLADDLLSKKTRLVMGFSADKRLKVIKANHFLDLNAFEEVRHWPKNDVPIRSYETMSLEERGDIIQARMSAIISALAQKNDLAMPISGGRDSRNLIAASKGVSAHVDQYFAFANNKMTRVDIELADQVTQALGLSFLPIYPDSPEVEPPPDRLAYRQYIRQYVIASGRTSMPAETLLLGLMTPIKDGAIVLRGGVIDLLRAVWWRSWPKRRECADVGEFDELNNLTFGDMSLIEAEPEIANRYKLWRDGLNEGMLERVHDYIFIELFYPESWQGYNGIWEHFMMCPAADRMLIDVFLSFDVESRFQLEVFRSLVQYLAPELADVPEHFYYRKKNPDAGKLRINPT